MRILSFFYSNPYSICERILRTCVFQIGVAHSRFERTLIWIYQAYFSSTCFPRAFDSKETKQNLEVFAELGADITFVYPRDGQAKIHMMHFCSKDLEEKIQAYGAKWEKHTIIETGQEKEILAIIPPKQTTEKWKDFEKKLLHLKWSKRVVEIKNDKAAEVIVTCENASNIHEPDFHRNLYLHVNPPTVSFTMLTRRIGFYLGCKQNGCFYDSRGTRESTGIPSEAGLYNDGLTVYEAIKNTYAPKNIWITSACGGIAAAAYIKSKTHTTEVNFIFESPYSDLKKDWVNPQGSIISSFAHYFWSGLASRDIPQRDKPDEQVLTSQLFGKI